MRGRLYTKQEKLEALKFAARVFHRKGREAREFRKLPFNYAEGDYYRRVMWAIAREIRKEDEWIGKELADEISRSAHIGVKKLVYGALLNEARRIAARSVSADAARLYEAIDKFEKKVNKYIRR